MSSSLGMIYSQYIEKNEKQRMLQATKQIEVGAELNSDGVIQLLVQS